MPVHIVKMKNRSDWRTTQTEEADDRDQVRRILNCLRATTWQHEDEQIYSVKFCGEPARHYTEEKLLCFEQLRLRPFY